MMLGLSGGEGLFEVGGVLGGKGLFDGGRAWIGGSYCLVV